MWQMADKVRVLSAEEWELFAKGLEPLCTSVTEDILTQEKATKTGVRAFDTLTSAQQITLMADVATALREPSAPAPKHTAVRDAVVAATFSRVRELLGKELDGDETLMRGLIRAAWRDRADRPQQLPPATRKSRDDWELLLEGIEGRVYWDRGYGQGVFDKPPEPLGSVKPERANRGYYQPAIREPKRAATIAARQILARLLGRVVPGDSGLYPGLLDKYHDLTIGPCSSEEIEQWEKHPWMRVADFFPPEWDCSYPLWLAEVRPAIPEEPFTENECLPVAPPRKSRGAPATPVSPSERLPFRIRALKLETEWVISGVDGYWCDILCDDWTDDAEEASSFPTEEAVCAAYLHAVQMYEERAARSRATRERLGIVKLQRAH